MTHFPALPLQQHPAFAAALCHMGRTVSFLDVPGAHRVLSVRVLGQKIVSRGPVWRCPEMRPCENYVAGMRVVNAETPDNDGWRKAGFRMLATAGSVAELDLTTPVAPLPKWRSSWRHAQRACVDIKDERFDPQAHAWLLRADRMQQRQKRYRALPHSFVTAFAAANPGLLRVYVAYLDASPAAAMLFLCHAPVVTYHIGWTGAAGREACLHHLMLMAAAAAFSRAGFTRLDLGAVDTETAAGLARFKIGCGALVRPLGGTWLRLARTRP